MDEWGGSYDWGSDPRADAGYDWSSYTDPWAYDTGWDPTQKLDWFDPSWYVDSGSGRPLETWPGYNPADAYDPAALATSDFSLPAWDSPAFSPGESGASGAGYDALASLFDPASGLNWGEFTRAGSDKFPEDMSGPAPSRSPATWGAMGTAPGTPWGTPAGTPGTQKGNLWGTGMSGQDMAALGGVGLNAAGLLSKLFDTGPKKDPLEQEMLQAQIDKVRAESERLRQPIPEPRGGGGGGGGGPLKPPGPGGVPNVQAFMGAAGLQGNDARFSALYDQVIKETGDLPKPNEAALAERTQAILAMQASEIDQRYEQAIQQVLEMANRNGTNPAGELAKLQQTKQQEKAGLQVQARTRALAEMQTQQAMALGRITPAMQLLQQVNPASYADVLSRVFGTPAPG